jgi:Spy/CpxP family protein refolding chaperone
LEKIMKTGMFGIGLLTIVLTAGFAATGIADAAPLGDDVPEARPLRKLVSGQFGRLLTLRSELDVTAEQRTQIRDIVKSHKSELAAALKPVAEKRRALREATLAESADESSIRAAADELGKAIGNAAVVGATIKAEVYQVLTPQQREKITEFRGASDSAVDRFLAEATAAE